MVPAVVSWGLEKQTTQNVDWEDWKKKQKGTQLKRGKRRKDVPRKGQWKKAAAPGVNKGSMRVVGTHFGVNE